jgi:superfamily I DNA/RNA helicase
MVLPTEEQLAAVEKFRTGRPLKIAAFAGAGKTTTLRILADTRPTRGLYLAFNRSIATEAKGKFPRNVDCRTTHSLAFRSVMPRYGSSSKMTNGLQVKQAAEVLRYRERIFAGPLKLSGDQQAHLVLGTIRRFCQSADSAVRQDHVPQHGRLLGSNRQTVEEVREWALQQARLLWARMINASDTVPLGHDGYLKSWALTEPRLAADYILLDEAQDTNAVVLGVLAGQQAQIVYVGDKYQQIYEWRGAVNAMETIAGCEETALTQSFRFGDEIAASATRVLATLGEQHRIRGNPATRSVILPSGRGAAVLARTNAAVILEVLEAINAGHHPHVCGGTKDITRLLGDVYELKAGKPALSPEFFGFQQWKDVVEFSDTEEGGSLRAFVRLVQQYGEAKLWAAIKKAVPREEDADVILSTAHKAKGREWESVRLASDFVSSTGSDPIAASEVRLFYVAMTRAKERLIVDPDVLRTFTTDAWKTRRQPEQGRETRFAGSEPPRQQVRPAPRLPAARPSLHGAVREIIPPAAVRGHPGATKDGFARAGAGMPRVPVPQGSPPSPARDGVREIISPEVTRAHPGTATMGRASAGTPKGFWSQIARLFRAS